MFESVNGWTDGHRLESHTISSPRAFGSGELKMTCSNPNIDLVNMNAYIKFGEILSISQGIVGK